MSGRLGRWVILGVAAVYFIGPLIATISFTVQKSAGGSAGSGVSFQAYSQIFHNSNLGQVGFGGALLYSLEIAVVTIAITLGLMLPTQLLLHLRLPAWRGLVEVISLLPLVFPPVVLVVGVSDVYRWAQPSGADSSGGVVYQVLRWIRADDHPLLLPLLYVMLAMPFVYRAIDVGIGSVDVRTMVEASRNLGASWRNVLLRVLVPALRSSLVNAAFLCFALVMGEFTIASILLYTKPFPVWLAQLPQTSGQSQAAVSVFSLVLVEVILFVIGAVNLRRSSEKKG